MTQSNNMGVVINMINYAALFRERRLKLGYSQYTLAKMAGISQPFLNQIETKMKKPSIDVFFTLCDTLKLEVTISEKNDHE